MTPPMPGRRRLLAALVLFLAQPLLQSCGKKKKRIVCPYPL